MRIVVIGGVAAGPKTASRIIRNNPDAEVILIEKGEFLSYAGCGLPYYVSDEFEDQKKLMDTPVGTVRDATFFKNVKNVNVMTRTEAVNVNKNDKTVTVKNEDGSETALGYDKLVLATGAKPIVPSIPGLKLKNIHSLYNVEDAEEIKTLLAEHPAGNAVIVGGGLIGVEMAEALTLRGCSVTIVELLPNILTMLDPEMAILVEKHFESKGVKVLANTKVTAFEGEDSVRKVITDKGDLDADMVILAIGVRPNVTLAKNAGLELGETRAIRVNDKMRTSDPDIYAVGDCVESTNLITKKPCYVPLGSTANKHGRVAANDICGVSDSFPGILGSSICKVFDFSVARTGLGEKAARDAGYDVVTCLAPAPDKPHFMSGMKPLLLKLIADKESRRLLGAQATGMGTADKRIDVAATAISSAMRVDQLANLDLCYAPPYSPAMDNILTAANILRNKMDGRFEGISSAEVKDKLDRGDVFVMLDVRSPGELKTMRIEPCFNIPLGKLRGRISELDKSKEIVVYCKISLRGYEASLILKNAGFDKVRVMDGGVLMWPYKKLTG